jgi:hypothetical protein
VKKFENSLQRARQNPFVRGKAKTTKANKIMKKSVQFQTISGWRITVAICVAGLLAAIPPKAVFATTTQLGINTSVSVGPVGGQVNITNPTAQQGGGYRSTLHVHLQDNTQTPPLNDDLVATGNAADVDTLLGGLFPAALIVGQDLLNNMTFDQAAADAQAKTNVTVTFFNDGLAEYDIVYDILVLGLYFLGSESSALHDDACTIRANLTAGMVAGGLEIPPDPCVIP